MRFATTAPKAFKCVKELSFSNQRRAICGEVHRIARKFDRRTVILPAAGQAFLEALPVRETEAA